ncbi:hypothetical protein [Variovorax fucosicus]|uniref:hypothetical protein n=1 Tax=Variovorax fucosicus TaxID=3053517 RepID=UPI0025789BBD|nr:hypothetical protein [Variovorax sp. J22G47]MDM0059250.1 hypothetical protein [Variovorax sp. J22G47]
MEGFATQLRESAHAAIVQSFRAALEGNGAGPTDADLKVFARLAVYEMKVKQRAGLPATQAPPEIPKPPAPRSRVPSAMLVSACLLLVCLALAPWPGTLPPVTQSASVARGQTPAVAAALTPIESAAAAVEPVPSAVASGTPARARSASVASLPRAPATETGVAATVRGRDRGTWGQLASCGSLNFISRAICMNNACAQPALGRSRSCADAVRQRRVDEARRNPMLMG